MNGKNQALNVSRRNLIKYGGGFLGTGLAATILGTNLPFPEPVVAQNIAQNKDLTPDAALKKLMDGNQRFTEAKRQTPNQTRERLIEIAENQTPFAAILGCADSRVPSEIIFDQGLGDIFVCRVAGNLATPEEIGSLEFGAMVLGAKIIVVIGHERCGAVQAAIKGGRYPGLIGQLTDGIQVAVERVEREPETNKLEAAVKANVLYQVERLNNSAVIADLVDKGQLKVVGAYFDLDTGKITLLS